MTALNDIVHEQQAQVDTWGVQDHLDGITNLALAKAARDAAKARCDRHAREGAVTWKDILLEEVFEALAEEDPELLKAELIQVAAVAASWADAIERRKL